jgi:hypothetical protein
VSASKKHRAFLNVSGTFARRLRPISVSEITVFDSYAPVGAALEFFEDHFGSGIIPQTIVEGMLYETLAPRYLCWFGGYLR